MPGRSEYEYQGLRVLLALAYAAAERDDRRPVGPRCCR